MTAFALVPALRGGRGPAAAAMALGRRRLAGGDPSHAPTRRWFASGSGSGNGNGNGGPVANGNGNGGPVGNGNGTGTGGSGASMGAAPSWTGCTGACAKEVLDLRAEMLWNNHQLWMRVNSLAEENVTLRSLIVNNDVNAKSRLMDLAYKLLYSGVAASIGTFVYYIRPSLVYLWYQMLDELADLLEKKPTPIEESPKLEEEVGETEEEEEGAGAEEEAPKKEEEVGETEEEEEDAGAEEEAPKKKEGSRADKPPKEEEVGGPKQSLKVEDDGGVDAKSPEEEKHGNAAKPPKKWGFFGV